MKLLLVDNAHLVRSKDGKYYTSSIYSYDFFKRYLENFENVKFVAKVKIDFEIDVSKYLLVSGPDLEIVELPWYQGPIEFVNNFNKIYKIIRNVYFDCDCSIYRIAQIESFLVYLMSNKQKPFAVEVVNDPHDFKDNNFILRTMFTFFMNVMINKAVGVSYVTKEYLQRKYPRKIKNNEYFESHYSSIELDEFANNLDFKKNVIDGKFKLVHVSNNINSHMKGHITVLDAVKIIHSKNYKISIDFIGKGILVEEFKNYSKKVGIENLVTFVGSMSSSIDVLNKLKSYDLFIFPSFYEGLPRVIIEAQAVGLPCLASNVGGIPELIKSRYLKEPNDSKAFADEIIRLINNPTELFEMRLENIENSKQYSKSNLREKRNVFYNKLRKSVEIKNRKIGD